MRQIICSFSLQLVIPDSDREPSLRSAYFLFMPEFILSFDYLVSLPGVARRQVTSFV